MTRRRLAERAIDTLDAAARPQSIGVVLNRVDFDRNKYYYSRYYGHHYKNYYGTNRLQHERRGSGPRGAIALVLLLLWPLAASCWT